MKACSVGNCEDKDSIAVQIPGVFCNPELAGTDRASYGDVLFKILDGFRLYKCVVVNTA